MIERLDAIASIVPAYQTRGAMKPDMSGSHFVVQAKDIDASFRLNPSSFIRATPDGEVDPYIIRTGDLLFLSRSRYGAAMVENVPANTLATGSVFILRVDPQRIHPKYLVWYFAHPKTQNQIRARENRGTMPFLRKNELASTEVVIPPIERQRAIAEAADLRRREHQLLLQLDELKQQEIDRALWRAAETKE